MYCSRYEMSCEEALWHKCDVPMTDKEQTGIECTNCVFCEVENEKTGTLDP